MLILDGTTGCPVTTVTGTLPVANGGTGVTTSTGTGANVLGTSPSISGAVMTTMASSVLTSATAQNSTSGTVIDFPSIPSWVKRITVTMLNVSLSGSAYPLIQLGTSGGIVSTGYTAVQHVLNNAGGNAGTSSTAGFITQPNVASDSVTLVMPIVLMTGTTWVSSHVGRRISSYAIFGGGDVTLGGTLDRVRITTSNGTDTFDAGSINIMYE